MRQKSLDQNKYMFIYFRMQLLLVYFLENKQNELHRQWVAILIVKGGVQTGH